MRSTSACAVSASATRYSMLRSKLFFEFPQGRDSPSFHIRQPAPYPFDRLQFIHPVQQFLIGSRILDHQFRLPVDSQDQRMAAASHLLQELARVPLEFAQRMNVITDIEHNSFRTKSALNLMLSEPQLIDIQPPATSAPVDTPASRTSPENYHRSSALAGFQQYTPSTLSVPRPCSSSRAAIDAHRIWIYRSQTASLPEMGAALLRASTHIECSSKTPRLCSHQLQARASNCITYCVRRLATYTSRENRTLRGLLTALSAPVFHQFTTAADKYSDPATSAPSGTRYLSSKSR